MEVVGKVRIFSQRTGFGSLEIAFSKSDFSQSRKVAKRELNIFCKFVTLREKKINIFFVRETKNKLK